MVDMTLSKKEVATCQQHYKSPEKNSIVLAIF